MNHRPAGCSGGSLPPRTGIFLPKEKMVTKNEIAGFMCIVASGTLAAQLAGFVGLAIVVLGVFGTAVYISGLLKG